MILKSFLRDIFKGSSGKERQPGNDFSQLTVQDFISAFHNIYYHGVGGNQVYVNTYWMGVQCFKCPLDAWIYQEILWRTKPDLIIETGSYEGGSALFLAQMCDLIGRGHVASIDIIATKRPQHPRITYLTGSSTNPEVIAQALASTGIKEKIMVILDSDHSEQHVLKELKLLSPLVSVGCYLIVEDTNINGHPVFPSSGPGPYEAVQKFLAQNGNFEVDRSCEKFFMTFNPNGYLKRVS